jgi:hypothetical protein
MATKVDDIVCEAPAPVIAVKPKKTITVRRTKKPASSEILDTDIEYLIKNNGQLLLELARRVTSILNEKQKDLQQCKWTDGESNTDTGFSELACKCAEDAWISLQQQHQPLSTSMITMVAVIPDINCAFSKNGKMIKVPKNKIELKSSKGLHLIGSTIRNLDINQPVIYCHRPKIVDGNYEIRYGQYHNGMVPKSDTDLFQDRTPRPPLNFDNLLFPSAQMEIITYVEKNKDAWIPRYAQCAVNRVNKKINKSWQDPLTQSIIFEAIKNIETMEELNKLLESVRPTLL